MGTPATVLDASFLISLLRSCWCSQARIDTASLIGSVLFDGFVQKNRPNSQSNNLDEYAPAAASLTLLRQCHAISPSQYFVNTSNISCNTVIQNQSQPTSCRETERRRRIRLLTLLDRGGSLYGTGRIWFGDAMFVQQ